MWKKTLLVTLFWGAAIATSDGASLTLNVVAGDNLIATPFDRGENTLVEVIPSAPGNSALYKYINGGFTVQTYDDLEMTWIPDPASKLNPGVGAILNSPIAFSLTLNGSNHSPVLPLGLQPGLNLVGCQTNASCSYDQIVGASPINGTVVYKYNPGSGHHATNLASPDYTVFTFSNNAWSPVSPSVAAGEAIWIRAPAGGPPVTNCLIFAGLQNCPLGGAVMTEISGQLQVTNLSSSGSDGVDVRLGAVEGVELDLLPLDLSTSGASLVLSSYGTLGGSSNVFLGRESFVNVSLDHLQVSVDYTSIGADLVTLEVYSNNVLVGSATVPAGIIGDVTLPASGDAGPAKTPKPIPGVDIIIKPSPNVIRTKLHFVDPVVFHGFTGDEIHLVPVNAAGPITALSSLQLSAANAPQLVILDEKILTTFTNTSPPVITQQPVSQIVAQGRTATFFVTAFNQPGRRVLSGVARESPAKSASGQSLPKLEGDPIPGVDVKLGRNPGGQLIAQEQSGEDGSFTFFGLRAGSYVLSVSSTGSAPACVTLSAADPEVVQIQGAGLLCEPVSIAVQPEFNPPSYQWLRNGQPVAGATNEALTLQHLQLGDSGAQLRVLITSPSGSVTSSVATLTVVPDTAPPAIVSVTADCASNKVTVTFSELVDALTAGDSINYQISGGVNIQSAALAADGRTVCLFTDPLTAGISYTLTVDGVQDLAGNVIAPNSQRTFTCTYALTLVCATNKTVECGTVWSFDTPAVTGGCTNVQIVVLTTVTNGACPWTIIRTWQVTDSCSNSVTCDQTVTMNPPRCVAGETWTPRENFRIWTSVASSADGNKLVAANYLGQIYTSIDSGVNWTPRESNRRWNSVASSTDGTRLAAVASLEQIYTSADSGLTWTPHETSRQWGSVASSHDGTKLIAGVRSGGRVYTSTDSGVIWTPRLFNGFWWVASSADGSRLAAVSDGDRIYTSADSGVTWTSHESVRNWISVASSADGSKLIALVNNGQIYISGDSGATWTPRESVRLWQSAAITHDGSVMVAVAYIGQIYISTDFGATWTPHAKSTTWEGVAVSADGSKMVAVENGGKIYTSMCTPATLTLTCATNKTVDYGSSWTFDAPGISNICCGSNGTISVVSTVTNGACPRMITRTWQAADCCGNTFTCTQMVTVVDTTPPVFTCASDKTLPCGTAWSFDAPSLIDDCCGANITVTVLNTVTNGTCPQTVTRTWQASDCCNNASTCSQTVTLVNVTPPVITQQPASTAVALGGAGQLQVTAFNQTLQRVLNGVTRAGPAKVAGKSLAKSEGDPIPNVDVKLGRNPGGQLVAQEQSGQDGSFTFSGLRAGSYFLSAASTGAVAACMTLAAADPATVQIEGAGLLCGLVSIVVQPEATPPSYQWLHNGQPIAGATSDTLILPAAAEADGGSYRVRVSNAQGTVESAVATVTISNPPGCVSLSQQRIDIVDPDGRQHYYFCVTNVAGFPIQYLVLLDLPAGADVEGDNPILLPNALEPGEGTCLDLFLTNLSAGTNLCFTLAAHDPSFITCCMMANCVAVPSVGFRFVGAPVLTATNGSNTFRFDFTIENISGQTARYLYLVPEQTCAHFQPGVIDLSRPANGGTLLPAGETRTLSATLQVGPDCVPPFIVNMSLHAPDLSLCGARRVRLPAPAPVAGPVIGIATAAGEGLKLRLETKTNETSYIEYTPSLSPPAWTTLRTIIGDGTQQMLSEPIGTNQGFYRLRLDR